MAERRFVCCECGAESLAAARGPIPERCSDCRQPPSRGPRPCRGSVLGCSAVVEGRRVWCSEACRLRVYNRRPEVKKRNRDRGRQEYAPRCAVSFPICDFCDERFVSRRRPSAACSKPECRRRFNSERIREFNARYQEETGERYAARYADRKAEANRRWREQNPDAARRISRKNRAKRRAIERGAEAEDFTHEEIFDRDSWRCGLCGRQVDKRLQHPHPLSASLDHIIPYDQGGQHVRANVQCTHLGCNLAKGTKALGEQLRLIG